MYLCFLVVHIHEFLVKSFLYYIMIILAISHVSKSIVGRQRRMNGSEEERSVYISTNRSETAQFSQKHDEYVNPTQRSATYSVILFLFKCKTLASRN